MLTRRQGMPRVMSLVFWAFHDGGEGVASSRRITKPQRRPLYIDDREANDVLTVYRVMLSSTFCIHIGGDTPTRKSFIDAIMAVCIPVVFQTDSVLFDSLPYSDQIPYLKMVVHVPIMEELTSQAQSGWNSENGIGGKKGQLMEHLRSIPDEVIKEKQRLLREYAPLLSYPYPKLQQSSKEARAAAGRRDEW